MTDTALERRGSALAIDPNQATWTADQKAAVLQVSGLAPNTPDAQLRIFFHQCQRTGMDPFARQIYMLGRATRKKVGGQWIDTVEYTIQTGIDGFRLVGHRAAERRRQKISKPTPEWCGEDGVWRDIWVGKKDPETRKREYPYAARVTIFVDGEPFTHVAVYEEYVQMKAIYGPKPAGGGSAPKIGEEPNQMWAGMPTNQLAKCAEAGAWREAFPMDLSGLYIDEELRTDNAINATSEVLATTVVGRGDGPTDEVLGFAEQVAACATKADGRALYTRLQQARQMTQERGAAIHARVLELPDEAAPETPDGAGDEAAGEPGGAPGPATGTSPAPPGEEPDPRDETPEPTPDDEATGTDADQRDRYCVHGTLLQHPYDQLQCRGCDQQGGIEWAEGEAPPEEGS